MTIRLFILLFISINSLFSQNTKDNLYTYSKLYGYIKYFYPDTSLYNANWVKICEAGVAKVINCKSKQELTDSLNMFFKDIAPLITISNNIVKGDLKEMNEDYFFWQHKGFGIYRNLKTDMSYDAYKSRIVSKQTSFFDYIPKHKTITEKICDSVFVNIPIILNKSEQNANPLINYFNTTDSIKKYSEYIELWNIIQHFFPYNKLLSLDMQKLFYEQILNRNSINKLALSINDGHWYVTNNKQKYLVNFDVKNIDNKIEVYCSRDSNIIIGDEIISIDDKDIKMLYDSVYNLTPGSNQLKVYLAGLCFDIKEVNDSAAIKLKRNNIIKTIKIPRQRLKPASEKKCRKYDKFQEIEENIYYVDLTKIEWVDLKTKLEELSQSNGVILDLRGRPSQENHFIIQHLKTYYQLEEKVFLTPLIVYPNFQKVKYEKNGWEGMAIKKIPQLNCPIVFLQDASSVSYTESFLTYAINPRKKIVSIGNKTGGANGNTNIFCFENICYHFTGMYVTDLKGKCYFSKGIEPTFYSDDDKIFEKAIKYINDNQ